MKRGGSLKRSELKRGKPSKRTQPRRYWTDARAKVEAEGVCRASTFTCSGKLEAAHVIGREHDPPCGLPGFARYVRPESIVPLCTAHHRAYDGHEFDLLPALTLGEQVQAVRDAGGIALALRRISGRGYGERAA